MSDDKKVTLSILGYGRFGAMLYEQLSKQELPLEVKVFSRSQKPEVNLVSWQEAMAADVIVPTVPISAFENLLKQMAESISREALVVDVCSVKVKPVEWMRKYLPASVEILATHPIFGPDSVKNNSDTLENLPLVYAPIRLSPHNQSLVRELLRRLQLNVVEMTPAEHDYKMAYSLLYTHFIGRIGEALDLQPTRIDTSGFSQLLKVQQYVVNDTWQLFQDMNKYNPYATDLQNDLQQALGKVINAVS